MLALYGFLLENYWLIYGEMTQANVDPALPREEWNLEALCAKVQQ